MLYKNLKDYRRKNIYPFHMPGHKRKMIDDTLPYEIDITEITGFDNLHNPKGIIKDLMDEMQSFYGTEETYLMVNGSSGGILSAISACAKKNGAILIARNCHKAVYHAVELLNLDAHYIYPEMNKENGIFDGISCEKMKKILHENPEIKTVVVTSPNYEGVLLDIHKISKVVHEHNAVLIVDEAHGAHLPFFEKTKFADQFPKSAISQGADIVIQSMHKTLPALTQTALLHICSKRVEKSILEHYLDIYQTSSPSYPFMASMEQAYNYCRKKENYDDYMRWLLEFREKTKNFKVLKLLSENDFWSEFYDITRIVIFIKDSVINGKQLFDKLLDEYQIECEMCQQKYVTAISTICDTKDGFVRLYDALKEIDEELVLKRNQEKNIKSVKKKENEQGKNQADYRSKTMLYETNETVMRIGEAFQRSKKRCPLKEAKQKIAGEYVYLYPPGIPVLVPGERITPKILHAIENAKADSMEFTGIENDKILIIDEKELR